jgi:hypothetical protein
VILPDGGDREFGQRQRDRLGRPAPEGLQQGLRVPARPAAPSTSSCGSISAATATRARASGSASRSAIADTRTIVAGGGLTRAADRILPRLSRIIERTVPFPPRMVPAHFTESAPLTGAVILALDAAAGRAADA